MMTRTFMLLFGLALLPAGCRDLGLPGNVPEQEARTAPPPELVAQVMTPAEREDVRLVVDGRLWVPTGMPMPRGEGQLRPVGATAGQTVYARAWDERPYRAIFTRVEMPAPEAAATARAAMDARLVYWQEYAPVIGQRGRVTAPARVRPVPLDDEDPEEDLAPVEAGPPPVEGDDPPTESAPGASRRDPSA
jgi:hypothetical protein